MGKKKKETESTWLIKVWLNNKMHMKYVDYFGDLVDKENAIGFSSKDACKNFAEEVSRRWEIPKKHMWLINVKETKHTLY